MPLKQISSVDIPFSGSNRPSKRLIEEAKFEKKWRNDPDQFNPFASAIKRDYFNHVKSCFKHNLTGISCVDLGSGFGELSKELSRRGADVTAVDISLEALKQLDAYPEIKKEQQFIPYTSLTDDTYDYVIAENLIAEIPEVEHRLFFSELARLVKPEGTILIATPLDIYSEDALHKLIYLAETEIALESLVLSYHRLFIRFAQVLKKINKPFGQWFENRDSLVKPFEKATQFLFDAEGVSYGILIGKRRPLFEPIPENERPIEHKGKKAVWE